MRPIVIAGGGTGGHLFPGLAVAAEIQSAGCQILWLGAKRGQEVTRVPAAGIPLRTLAVTGAVGCGPLAALGAALRLPPAWLMAQGHLLRCQVGAVLAVGGYAALPGGIAAASLGVPLIVQEQNVLPGVTNRLLAPWSVAIVCGFRDALAAFPSLPARWTGNPVRSEFFGVGPPPGEESTILVLGGSQGSAFLNRVLPEVFSRLALRLRLPHIVHQAGSPWQDEVRERYATHAVTADVEGFLENPWDELARARLVIARAGALTVSEIAAARRPALLIPLAAATHDHQLRNAEALAATGAAAILEERQASPRQIATVLGDLLTSSEDLARRGEAGAAVARPDAARDIASLVLARAGVVAAGGEKGAHP